MSEPGPMDCDELVELITDFIEGHLPPEEHARLEYHLAQCEPCNAYLEQMRLTIRTLGRLENESLPVKARGRLLAAFRDWKSGQSG